VRAHHTIRWTISAALLFGIAATCVAGKLEQSPAPSSSAQDAKAQHEAGKPRFLASLPQGFQVPPESDEAGTRLLAYYGAVFVARGGAMQSPVLMFSDEEAVIKWQASLTTDKMTIRKTIVELQSVAFSALMAAKAEAEAKKIEITPRGTDPARRDYKETVKWWESRVVPGLDHWVAAGKLVNREARRIRELSPADQVPEIFRLEENGLFFGGNFSRTILSSVAPPGASQHISMLAVDINEDENAAVRAILAKHGWFQTVLLDTPHFTYLGVLEKELPELGLQKVSLAGRDYWIPDLGISIDELLGRRARPTPTMGRNN
jgi:hypothetical protein